MGTYDAVPTPLGQAPVGEQRRSLTLARAEGVKVQPWRFPGEESLGVRVA